MYNGHDADDLFTPTGLKKLGVDWALPWVARGVCLDIPAARGIDVLTDGSEVTPDDLEAACERQSLEIGGGDAVLIHTGWGRLRTIEPVRYGGNEPGPGMDAARWLTTVVSPISGKADNWALEAICVDVLHDVGSVASEQMLVYTDAALDEDR